MAMFDYMLEALKGKKKPAPTPQVDDLAAVKERLKKIVYDDKVVDELAPIFGKLEGGDNSPIWELLEAKEAMLTEVGEDFFKQSSTPTVADQDDGSAEDKGSDKIMTAEDILRAQYSAK